MGEIVSIVIAVYNIEKYITECLETIVNQTYKNLEILVVDDGSEDRSSLICKQFAKKDNRVQYIRQENQGLSAARNTGIKKATGKYICFIDGDDWIKENYVERLYFTIKKYDADVVICDFSRDVDEMTKKETDIGEKIIDGKEVLYNLQGDKHVKMVVAWNKMYKREIFDTVQYPYGKLHEDEFVIHKIMYSANKIIEIGDRLYYYRNNPNGITKQKFGKKNFDHLEALKERLLFFEEKKEDVLYDRTLRNYCLSLTKNYNSSKNNKHDFETIKKEQKKYMDVLLKRKTIDKKTKLKFLCAKYAPNLVGYKLNHES